MIERFKQLKENITKMEVTNLNLKGKIETIEAADVALQGKIDAKYTQLEGKIDAAGPGELKKNLSFAIPDYDKLVESKYCRVHCLELQPILLFR